jgi:hypothetical protein
MRGSNKRTFSLNESVTGACPYCFVHSDKETQKQKKKIDDYTIFP